MSLNRGKSERGTEMHSSRCVVCNHPQRKEIEQRDLVDLLVRELPVNHALDLAESLWKRRRRAGVLCLKANHNISTYTRAGN